MSGQPRAVVRSQHYLLCLQSKIRFSPAVDQGPLGLRAEDIMAHKSRPYAHWRSAALGPLDELFARASALGVSVREAPPLEQLGQSTQQEGGVVSTCAIDLEMDEAVVTFATARPLTDAERESWSHRVRQILWQTRPRFSFREGPAFVPAVRADHQPVDRALTRLWLRVRKIDAARVSLRVSFSLQELKGDELQELTLRLELRNEGGRRAELYPSIAQFAPRADWGSPTWTLSVLAAGYDPGRGRFVAVRSVGAPALQSSRGLFKQSRRWLAPGAKVVQDVPCCFVPGKQLPPLAMLSRAQQLAPGDDSASSSLLLLHESRSAVVKWLAKGGDTFASAGALLVPAEGLVRLSAVYEQRPWGAFEPLQSWTVRAPETELLIRG
jgi:hypothetical protein